MGKREKLSELEKNLLARYSLITVVGSEQMMVEGLRGILDYSAETLRVNTLSGVILIMGAGLEITSMTAEALSLKGKITSLEFCI